MLFYLDKSTKKYTCPQCTKKTFTPYVYADTKQIIDETRFGRCDRENNCSYHALPDSTTRQDVTPKPNPRTIFILPTADQVRAVVNYDYNSNLHSFLKTINIPMDHCQRWGVFSHKYFPNRTVFLFQRIGDRAVVNWKIFLYLQNGHRNKETNSYSLGSPKFYFDREKENFELKYPMCLYGEHLFTNEKKPVIIVESEKSAFISSHFYPQYDWVACGSNNGLTAISKHKLKVLFDRHPYWLCDSDKAGRDNRSIENLSRNFTQFKTIDLFPEKDDGYDIADSIIDGVLPDIL